jgi:hypothetical protein
MKKNLPNHFKKTRPPPTVAQTPLIPHYSHSPSSPRYSPTNPSYFPTSPSSLPKSTYLNFMQHGGFHVAQKELKSFLTLAGKLGVTGFTPAITELPYPTLPRPYPTLPKPPYLMDIDVPVPRDCRCGGATSLPLQECPSLPLTTEGFARPSYPSLASAKPVGYPSPATFPPSSAIRDHSSRSSIALAAAIRHWVPPATC